jgi:hypothetical protein
VKRGAALTRTTPMPLPSAPMPRTEWLSRPATVHPRLRQRSKKTAAKYVTRREIVAELFAEPSICEVPWCTERATDPHEPLTRARGGDILDRANIRLVCHPHNVMFGADEQPWMYSLGFLVHSWDKGGAS